MRKISASFIMPGNRPPMKNGILICADDGTINDLIDTKGNLTEQAGLEFYNGIIVPGFVNSYCKLESYPLSEIPHQVTDSEALSNLLNNSDNSLSDFARQAIGRSNLLMQQAGIVAAGDFSHSILTLATKKISSIYYHTFIETFGRFSHQTERIFTNAQLVEKEFQEAGLPVSLTPHSLCSTSPELLVKIWNDARGKKRILSVVNTCLSETTPYIYRRDLSNYEREMYSEELMRKHKIITQLPHLTTENHLILVHDQEIQKSDFSVIEHFSSGIKTYLVLCPNSILTSCGTLHSVNELLKGQMKICLGTGHGSNNRWSVLNEMFILQTEFPEITLHQLIEWACSNGAEALGTGSEMGSFEKGKNPGINLITGVDLQQLRLRPDSKVKVLQKARKNYKVQ